MQDMNCSESRPALQSLGEVRILFFSHTGIMHGSGAGVAQLVEQRIRNAKVSGSIPLSGTNKISDLRYI